MNLNTLYHLAKQNGIRIDNFVLDENTNSLAVYVNNKLTTVLTPNDLFIGEMAFLLNDRRTATILAVGECKVIKLQKADFLVLIRKNPHYGIFLSKMLAQRLVRQTKATIEAKNELKKIREEN